MNVPEYLAARGTNLHQLSQATGIGYPTLHKHVRHGAQLSLRTAKKLEAWSKGQMTAAEILGLEAKPARKAPARAARIAKARKAAA